MVSSLIVCMWIFSLYKHFYFPLKLNVCPRCFPTQEQKRVFSLHGHEKRFHRAPFCAIFHLSHLNKWWACALSASCSQGGRSGTKASVMGKEQHRLRHRVQERHAVLHSHQPSTTRPSPAQLPLPVLPHLSVRHGLCDQRLPAASRRSQHLTGPSWLQQRRHTFTQTQAASQCKRGPPAGPQEPCGRHPQKDWGGAASGATATHCVPTNQLLHSDTHGSCRCHGACSKPSRLTGVAGRMVSDGE